MAGTCERWTHKIHYPCIGVCACVQGGRQCKNTLHNNKTTSILHVSRVYALHMIHALSTSVYMVPVSLSLWMKNYTLFTIDVLYIYTYMLLPNTCLKEWIITLKLERKNLFLNIPAVFLLRGAVTHTFCYPGVCIYMQMPSFPILSTHVLCLPLYRYILYTTAIGGCHWHSVCSRLEIQTSLPVVHVYVKCM